MANNGKKEFPINGTEEDVISKHGRTIYCYIKNGRGITKSIKNQLNKRFRKYNKNISKENL